jgi:peroxiredoxin
VGSGGPREQLEQEASGVGSPEVPARLPRDRVFKWVTAVAAACLLGFVLYVIVHGPSRGATPSTAALRSSPPSMLKTGASAPSFTLPDLASGEPVSLVAFRGEPVIVNFFASWCPDCRQELAAVASVARTEAGKVAVVGVDSNESSTTTASRLLAGAHATYPVGLDADAKVATDYLVNALPVTYFLNAEGRVEGVALGPQTATSLRRWAQRLERGQKGASS